MKIETKKHVSDFNAINRDQLVISNRKKGISRLDGCLLKRDQIEIIFINKVKFRAVTSRHY